MSWFCDDDDGLRAGACVYMLLRLWLWLWHTFLGGKERWERCSVWIEKSGMGWDEDEDEDGWFVGDGILGYWMDGCLDSVGLG